MEINNQMLNYLQLSSPHCIELSRCIAGRGSPHPALDSSHRHGGTTCHSCHRQSEKFGMHIKV